VHQSNGEVPRKKADAEQNDGNTLFEVAPNSNRKFQ